MHLNLTREIVLIADRLYKLSEDMDVHGSELEMISNEYFEEVYNGLKPLAERITHYNSPKEFINNVSKHSDLIVFTIYGGTNSINRMALVPGVCESYDIRFAGADVYGRVLCQDKYLSKLFAERFGIKTANAVLIDKLSRIDLINDLKFPVVVKPNFEGSSIGISNSSLVVTPEDAKILVKKQFLQYTQPIIVEEFIAGLEVCVCIIGTRNKVDVFEVVEVVNDSDPFYFHSNLYTATEKYVETSNISHQLRKGALSGSEISCLKDVFRSFPKMDYMRIDGRLNETGFHLIEFTPDAYIGESSTMNAAAQENGLSYNELLGKIINNALDYYRTPYSSYI